METFGKIIFCALLASFSSSIAHDYLSELNYGFKHSDIKVIQQQCEKDLPRSKKCHIVLTTEVVDNKEEE